MMRQSTLQVGGLEGSVWLGADLRVVGSVLVSIVTAFALAFQALRRSWARESALERQITRLNREGAAVVGKLYERLRQIDRERVGKAARIRAVARASGQRVHRLRIKIRRLILRHQVLSINNEGRVGEMLAKDERIATLHEERAAEALSQADALTR
jgi:hypothetical protein